MSLLRRVYALENVSRLDREQWLEVRARLAAVERRLRALEAAPAVALRLSGGASGGFDARRLAELPVVVAAGEIETELVDGADPWGGRTFT